jgi:hypothetical protein
MAKANPTLSLLDGFACGIRCPQVNSMVSLLALKIAEIPGGREMSRKTKKVVCRASGGDFIFKRFAGKSFSTQTFDSTHGCYSGFR